MYTDAYSTVISDDVLSRAARLAADLHNRCPWRSAEACAREVVCCAFCPCLDGTGGCCEDGTCLRSAIVAEVARRITDV